MTSGTIWNLTAALSTQGATFLTNLIVSNLAGIDLFGRYAMIQNTLTAVAGLSTLSMGFTTTKFVSEFRTTDKERTAQVLRLCSLIALFTAAAAALILFAGAPIIAKGMLRAPGLATSMRIGAAFLFFSTVNAYQLGALSGLESYKLMGAAAAASGIIAVVVSTLGMLWFGLTGAILGQAIAAAFRYLVHRRMLTLQCSRSGILKTRSRLAGQAQILWRFALPAALSGYLSIPAIWFANMLLFRQIGGASQVAIYTAALTFKTILLFLPNTITGVSLSVLNNTKGTSDVRQYLTLYRFNITLVFGILLVTGIPFMLFAGPLLRAFGRDFSSGRSVLMLLTLSTFADGITVAAYPLIQSQGRMWLSFWALAVPRDTIFAILAFWWIPVRGALGLAQSQLTVSVLVAAVTLVVSYRLVTWLLRSSVATPKEAYANV